MIHLHKGKYQGVSSIGADKLFHISIPYMFDEKELVEFMKGCLLQLQNLSKPERKAIL